MTSFTNIVLCVLIKKKKKKNCDVQIESVQNETRLMHLTKM